MNHRLPVYFASLLLLVSFCTASGCTKSGSSQNSDPGITTDPPGARSYLALGDSYTIGESVSESARFPAQTVALLQAKGIIVGTPEYIARTGWTTLDLQTAIQSGTKKPVYDIVTLLIGVNDQYQGLDTAGYRIHFGQLLETAITFAGGQSKHVFVLSIPDYSVTPFGGGSKKTQMEINAFNSINKEVTDARKVAYVDITPASRKAETDQTYTANDGLHPSAKQYADWAGLLVPQIQVAFK